MNTRVVCLAIVLFSTFVRADDSWTSRDGHFNVSFESEIDPITINRMHRWQLEIADADGNAISGARISVAGGMPAHDHGLPTRPRVTGEAGPGRYILEGMRFHMGGLWELELTIELRDLRDVVVIRLEL